MIEEESVSHTWDYCTHCKQDVIVCGKCGNSCCNGGYGELANGKECDACPSAYEMQSKGIKMNMVTWAEALDRKYTNKTSKVLLAYALQSTELDDCVPEVFQNLVSAADEIERLEKENMELTSKEDVRAALQEAMESGASIRSQKLAELFELKKMPEAASLVRSFELFAKPIDKQ